MNDGREHVLQRQHHATLSAADACQESLKISLIIINRTPNDRTLNNIILSDIGNSQ